ncbi:MAG TPA: dihydrolipoyl dehydrogenase [Tepidisphaeraceae bacterium]|jgi:dihydrolipoamide dehydrogenase|nr:dihydrolipoyl dehydrogenase [Tepidisphaeraceae bacterium]
MSENTFDLIVIGAGPGGYVAAIRAAQLGMRVACIEKDASLGGTCLNVGCIPSKALLDSSEHFYLAKNRFAHHGIKVGNLELDLPAMMSRKDQVVQGLTRGVAGLFRKNKVEHVRGTGRVTSPNTVEVTTTGETKKVNGKRILIATGSAPVELRSIPFDGKNIVSSTEAIAFGAVPKKLIVVGAGAIGLELGSVWSRLGSEVLVIEFLDRVAPLMDIEMTTALRKALEKQGMKFKFKTTAESAKVENGRVKLSWRAGEETGTEECDKVLVSVGRRPYTENLGLREIGVEMDQRGFVKVNDHFETNLPGIYAIGDVIGGAMLAHKAEDEGIAAVERMANVAGHVNYLAIPNVIYTHPELASVGYSEEDAKAKGIEYKIGKFPFAANGRAKAMDDSDGMVKILADAKTDRLIGMHILGPRASDIIAEGAVAIELMSSTEDIARSSHAHPTLPEAIREAAMAVDKRAIHF